VETVDDIIINTLKKRNGDESGFWKKIGKISRKISQHFS
jgi:hypothetical protein